MLPRTEIFRQNFLQRTSKRSTIQASFWLLSYASIPTLAFSALIIALTVNYCPDFLGQLSNSTTQKNPQWIPSLVFNPIIESALLAIAIKACIKMKFGVFSYFAAAIVLSALHSIANPYWGMTIFLFFLVQSYALFYAYAADFKRGYIIIVLTHVWHNALVLAVLLSLKKFT